MTGRSMRVALIWALCAVLVGCGSMTERAAAWYVTRTIGKYLDLSSAQRGATRVQVDQTIDLLRRGELGRWVSFLREVRQGFHEGLSEDDLVRLQRHYDSRLDAGVELLVPRFAPLLVQLAAAQLDHFAERMREDVDEQYDDLELPEAERRAAIEKRALKLVSGLVGDLGKAQEERVRALIRALPNERAVQHQSALANIGKFRGFMAGHPSEPALEAELHAMWSRRYDALGPGRDKATRRGEQRAWLLAVFRLLTVEQRAHAEQELSERIIMLKRWVITS